MINAFVDCQKMLSYSELDGCNNAGKQSVSFYELLADKYKNDLDFVISSLVMPDLHSAFKEPMLLLLDDCPENVTPEQVKE